MFLSGKEAGKISSFPKCEILNMSKTKHFVNVANESLEVKYRVESQVIDTECSHFLANDSSQVTSKLMTRKFV